MKIKTIAWKYLKPNESMLFVVGGFLVIAIITAITMYRSGDGEEFSGELKYENLSQIKKKRNDLSIVSLPVEDEDKNVRLTERIREGSALGLGLSLFLVGERVGKNRFMTIAEAMRDFEKSPLLPPGAVVLTPDIATSYGLVKTGRGLYYINYSAKPLKIEILAAGLNGLSDGAVFVLRIPDASAANLKPDYSSPKISSAGAWATIFEAPDNQNHYIPPAFSPAESFTAMNWQIRPLQQTAMSPDRIRQLNDFMAAQEK